MKKPGVRYVFFYAHAMTKHVPIYAKKKKEEESIYARLCTILKNTSKLHYSCTVVNYTCIS